MAKNKESTDIHCNKCNNLLGIAYHHNPEVKYVCVECPEVKESGEARPLLEEKEEKT